MFDDQNIAVFLQPKRCKIDVAAWLVNTHLGEVFAGDAKGLIRHLNLARQRRLAAPLQTNDVEDLSHD